MSSIYPVGRVFEAQLGFSQRWRMLLVEKIDATEDGEILRGKECMEVDTIDGLQHTWIPLNLNRCHVKQWRELPQQ